MASRPSVRPARLLVDGAGSAATQLALVLPIFLGFTLGIMDAGRLMWTQVTIDQAAKKGARFAIVHGSASASPASADAIADCIREKLTALDPTAAGVTVSWDPDNAPGSSVSVLVTYPFRFVGLTFLSVESITLDGSATMVISN